MSQKLFAFDIGTGSLGIAVREGNEIIDARSLIIPENVASTKEQRERRGQWRTREAHKAREIWLKEQCINAGIPVMKHACGSIKRSFKFQVTGFKLKKGTSISRCAF